ncbi:MAG TPA: metallophosphoesterase [Clostridia bacterium]|nr:metallophosphoesterase [Clostridia bacterium]
MFEKKITAIIVSVIASLNLFLYVSMRSVLGFLGYFLHFPFATYLLGAILAAMVVVSFINLLHKNNKIRLIVLAILDILFFTLVLGWFIGNIDNYRVFLVEMVKLLIVYAAVAIIVYLIFYFHKSKIYTKTVATIVCIVLILGIIIGFTDISSLKINYMSTGAAVYAVEDEYQIVWATSNKALGWVEIDGTKYYDELAGSIRSTDTVHKVVVPQKALDNAKRYTVYSKTMINEESYSALLGRTFSKTYLFRPVDTTDGIQYYAVSDTHGNNKKAFSTTDYYGDATDFVILGGDTVSYLSSKYDLERIVKLAHGVSGGNIPVIYARGNHEVKGVGAESLYKYVGANKSNGYYFSFKLGSVWGIVLDMGENHEDEWKENFGTANFDGYRNAQIELLDEIIDNKTNSYQAEDVTHKIAISHINTSFTSDSNLFMYDYLIELNQRLNQIDLDVMVSGHLHQVFLAPKGAPVGSELKLSTVYKGSDKENSESEYIATGAMYDTIICSRRSNTQVLSTEERTLGKRSIGAALQYKIDNQGDGVLEVRFTTDAKKIINTVNPFTGESYGSTIYLY